MLIITRFQIIILQQGPFQTHIHKACVFFSFWILLTSKHWNVRKKPTADTACIWRNVYCVYGQVDRLARKIRPALCIDPHQNWAFFEWFFYFDTYDNQFINIHACRYKQILCTVKYADTVIFFEIIVIFRELDAQTVPVLIILFKQNFCLNLPIIANIQFMVFKKSGCQLLPWLFILFLWNIFKYKKQENLILFVRNRDVGINCPKLPELKGLMCEIGIRILKKGKNWIRSQINKVWC